MKLVVFIFCCCFLTQIFATTCKNGSVTFQNHCYYFETKAATFKNAEFACKKLNGHLISLHDAFTSAFIRDESLKASITDDFWIGIQVFISGNLTTSWTDNTPVDFTDWRGPGPTSPACGKMKIDYGYWDVDDCQQQKSYACEIPNDVFINCTMGWLYYEPTDSCYGQDYNYPQALNWHEAEIFCNTMNAHLVSVHDEDEMRFVSSLIPTFSYGAWSGLCSYDYIKTWNYTDGSAVDYLPWLEGFPRNGADYSNPTCAFILHEKLFNAVAYSTFICKKSASSQKPHKYCIDGWRYNYVTKSCYLITNYGSFTTLEKYCKTFKGGHLSSFTDTNELLFIDALVYNAYMSRDAFWIGLFSDDNGVTWKFTDGTSLNFNPWLDDYPIRGQSICASAMSLDYSQEHIANDNPCSQIQLGVCKMPSFNL